MRLYVVYDDKDKCPTQKDLHDLKKLIHLLDGHYRLHVVSDSPEVRQQAKLMGIHFVGTKINGAVEILH